METANEFRKKTDSKGADSDPHSLETNLCPLGMMAASAIYVELNRAASYV